MSMPLLATKLYTPPQRPNLVLRPRLVERLNDGLSRKLTLISAPAGFGKTTLICEGIGELGVGSRDPQFAWLSLDEGDNDLARFLTYCIVALQTVEGSVGQGALNALKAPQPPPIEALLTSLINEITTLPDQIVLVLDDYHIIEAQPIHEALAFLLEHLPPQLHLVVATREDPPLPLARLRARGQLAEVRVADLRFTPAEAADFFSRVMGLDLSADEVAALEARTEGWIAGLQLAALSMRGHQDTTGFIKSFTGSHHFVLDYLVEEVLHQQPKRVQTFLLHTSILDRLCGSLCDAVLDDPFTAGQETLEHLERANLFIVPLDGERRWYRYHHLFASFLRQRLRQSAATSPEDTRLDVAALHVRASQWYEDHGLMLEAFHHAAAASDVERAERLIGSKAMPVHFRPTVNTIVDWLASLPDSVRDARPALWVKSATLSLVAGQTTGVEENLQAAERALEHVDLDDKTRDLIGQIACARATLALTRYEPEVMIIQARRALEYVHPDDLTFRFTAHWALASANFLQGNRAEAAQACRECLAISQKSGDMFSTTLALRELGQIQEVQNQLYQAAATYQRLMSVFGEHPQPHAGEVHLGLARIYYEWNDLEAAEQHGQRSLELTQQYDRGIDRFVLSELLLARLKLAWGDVDGAAAQLAQVEQSVRQNNFVQRMADVAVVRVLILLRQGDIAAAAHLAKAHELPLSQARVLLAQGDPSAALSMLEPFRQEMEARDWQDERLKAMVLQAVALRAAGEKDKVVDLLGEALALAEPGGFVRIFVDEGPPMAQLLSEAAARGIMPDYVGKLLTAFEADQQKSEGRTYLPSAPPSQPLIEPLSERELEVLQLVAQGLSNREISKRLFLALSTVKGHNRNIFGKLQVHRRTEAVARARELGLL
jgi:LuxR family maltose regulon positive regulatory protein